MSASKIEWTETTWNPVTGCTKISSGCKHCYAERMSLRLQAMGTVKYENGFRVTCHEDLLDLPMTWKKGRMIFVNSMSDLFHEDVPIDFLHRVFKTMRSTPQHIFQVLTKRTDRLASLNPDLHWANNIWMGVTVEDRDCLHRIDTLRECDAEVKFLSCEPLLQSLGEINLTDIDWVIVGGESGPGARPMEKAWVEELMAQCQTANVPFFFKQWGGVNKKKKGRILNGRIWEQMPRVFNHPLWKAEPCLQAMA